MPARTSERTCIVTRQPGGKDALIRFVLSPDQIVVPDLKERLPGRGAWVTANTSILSKAIEKRLFDRALKAPIAHEGTERLLEQTELALRRHAAGSLGLARKAGLVLTGFAKVESALKKGTVSALLHATTAGKDGKEKLNRLAKHARVPTYCLFSHDELAFSLGREHVVHAALEKSRDAEHFVRELRRLDEFVTR
ncbi:MAG: RNA-binding protein [Pseudomonadota bacterium]